MAQATLSCRYAAIHLVYLGIYTREEKMCPSGRGFSSEFDRKRGFDREAARKTIVFRQPPTTLRKQGGFSLSKKYYFDFYASCGSTHKIEFAKQIHKFREHVSRNLYKGRKNVSAGRGFSSRFARKRGFEREAARKTLVFRQPQASEHTSPRLFTRS